MSDDYLVPYDEDEIDESCENCSGEGTICQTCDQVESSCECPLEDQEFINCSECDGTGIQETE